MLNQVILVGKVKEIKGGKIKIAVNRTFKNEEGIYESDIIPVVLSGCLNETFKDYCKVDDVIGVKGRLESTERKIYVCAEKVTFLSTKKEENE